MFRKWWIISLSLLWLTMPGWAQTSAGIQITVSDVTLKTDEQATVLVQIVCPEAICAAVDLSLQYDPTFIALDDVAWGGFPGVEGLGMLTVHYVHDPQLGLLRAAYVTLPTATTVPQTTGDLLILDVRALAPGSSAITVTEITAGSMDGLRIEPVISQPGEVTVTESTVATRACPGDIDGDGLVGASDLNLLVLAFGEGDAQPLDADVNADGTVNILDAIIIERHLNLSLEECGS